MTTEQRTANLSENMVNGERARETEEEGRDREGKPDRAAYVQSACLCCEHRLWLVAGAVKASSVSVSGASCWSLSSIIATSSPALLSQSLCAASGELLSPVGPQDHIKLCASL